MTKHATLSDNGSEGKMLQKFAAVLTATSPNGVECNVEDAYFDSTQDWLWTTIMAEYTGENGYYECWQAISQAWWDRFMH